jgi:ribosome-binding factor A
VARKRNPRVDRDVRSALADLLETEIADPRVAFVTLTDVDVTPDHEVATIFYSTLDPDLVTRDPRRTGGDRIPDPQDVAAGLSSAAPRLRTLLAGRVKLRTTPELRFRADPVVGQATRIDELLRDIDTADGPETAGSQDDSVYKERPSREDDR